MCDEKRKRAPNWQLPERELLLELVEEHYDIIECKKLDGATLKRKDAEWALMARKYNARTSLFPRTDKVLRCQWTALRKTAKKDETMRQENGTGPHTTNPLHDRIVQLIQSKLNEVSSDSFDNDVLPDTQDDDSEDFLLPSCSKESKEQKFDTSTFNRKGEIKSQDDNTTDDSDGEHERAKASAAFSARDCRLLLHCVRQEKNVLFTNSPLIRKQKAWSRIAQTFNRQSPTKRSHIELKKKFLNLKSMASKVNNGKKFILSKNNKYEELSEEGGEKKKIKCEPKSEGTGGFEYDDDDDDEELDKGHDTNHDSAHSDINYDPLLNGVCDDSELNIRNNLENKKLNQLKMELLNYELKTAKLQRKRIEDAIESENADRDLRALETSLKIRAARLEVLAAESKITPLHPALAYMPEEMRAQQYLSYPVT